MVGVTGKLSGKNLRRKRPLPKITTKFPVRTGIIWWISVALTGVLAEIRPPYQCSAVTTTAGPNLLSTSQKLDGRQKSGGNLRCQQCSWPLLLRRSAQPWQRHSQHKLFISKFILGVTLPCLDPLPTAAAAHHPTVFLAFPLGLHTQNYPS